MSVLMVIMIVGLYQFVSQVMVIDVVFSMVGMVQMLFGLNSCGFLFVMILWSMLFLMLVVILSRVVVIGFMFSWSVFIVFVVQNRLRFVVLKMSRVWGICLMVGLRKKMSVVVVMGVVRWIGCENVVGVMFRIRLWMILLFNFVSVFRRMDFMMLNFWCVVNRDFEMVKKNVLRKFSMIFM